MLEVEMISKDILDQIKKDGGVQKKKAQSEIDQEKIDSKLDQILAKNKYVEDSIARIKEQITKGKEYKFVLNRDKDGMIKEVIAVPIGV